MAEQKVYYVNHYMSSSVYEDITSQLEVDKGWRVVSVTMVGNNDNMCSFVVVVEKP
jgi:hypothetical protein